jgi:hypothetical protein
MKKQFLIILSLFLFAATTNAANEYSNVQHNANNSKLEFQSSVSDNNAVCNGMLEVSGELSRTGAAIVHYGHRKFWSAPATQWGITIFSNLVPFIRGAIWISSGARIVLGTAAATGGVTIVGEGMKRVSIEAAKHPNSVILNNMPKFAGAPYQITSQMMTYNRQWILQQMRSGRTILDIGVDVNRTIPSIFYQMEQNMLKNYLKLHPNAFKIIRP